MIDDDDTDWSLIDFDDPKKPAAVQPVAGKSCPKCGRPLGRGGHFHVQKCKGVNNA